MGAWIVTERCHGLKAETGQLVQETALESGRLGLGLFLSLLLYQLWNGRQVTWFISRSQFPHPYNGLNVGDLQWRPGLVSCLHSAVPSRTCPWGLHSYLWNLSPRGSQPPPPCCSYFSGLLGVGSKSETSTLVLGRPKGLLCFLLWRLVHSVRNGVPLRGEGLSRFAVKALG